MTTTTHSDVTVVDDGKESTLRDLPKPEFTDAEMDEIEAAADALGDNIYRPGVCAPAADAPKDAGRQAALLARLGRVDARLPPG